MKYLLLFFAFVPFSLSADTFFFHSDDSDLVALYDQVSINTDGGIFCGLLPPGTQFRTEGFPDDGIFTSLDLEFCNDIDSFRSLTVEEDISEDAFNYSVDFFLVSSSSPPEPIAEGTLAEIVGSYLMKYFLMILPVMLILLLIRKYIT